MTLIVERKDMLQRDLNLLEVEQFWENLQLVLEMGILLESLQAELGGDCLQGLKDLQEYRRAIEVLLEDLLLANLQ